MKYETTSHRFGLDLIQMPARRHLWDEIHGCLAGISDDDIINVHESYETPPKSLSPALNKLLKDRFTSLGWIPEARIFKSDAHSGWRLDFAKESVCIEVAFNHGEAIAWNLMKPVLSSEINPLEKDFQTEIGVVICATQDLKTAGGFDSAVGVYEDFTSYVLPMRNYLTVPMVVIGLNAPASFSVHHVRDGNRNRGYVTRR